MNELDLATRLVANHTSVVPIRPGEKRPALKKWEPFQTRLPTEDELLSWFGNGSNYGLGIVQGAPDDSPLPPRELIDFDVHEVAHRKQLGGACLKLFVKYIPDLAKRCAVVFTPSGGWHLHYRCEAAEGNKTWAHYPGPHPTLIETRGIGGQALAPGNPGYEHWAATVSVDKVGTITPDERAILYKIARSFDQCPHRERPDYIPEPHVFEGSDRPGDIFNREGDWPKILEPQGWTHLYTLGNGEQYWRRPDKDGPGSSATVYPANDACPIDLIVVYSSNTRFPTYWSGNGCCKGVFTKFATFTFLHHNGNFQVAAHDLEERGYHVDLTDIQRQVEKACEVESDSRLTVKLSKQDDPWYSYLWKGNHSRLGDLARSARIRSIDRIRALIPDNGFFPEYIKTHLPTSDTSVDYHLGSALGLAGSLLNRRLLMPLGASYLGCNLWINLTGPSSVSRKTTAIDNVKSILSNDSQYYRTVLSGQFSKEGLWTSIGGVFDGEQRREEAQQYYDECGKRDKEGTFCADGVALFHVDELGGFLKTLNSSYNEGLKELITSHYAIHPRYEKQLVDRLYCVYRPCLSLLSSSTIEWARRELTASDLRGGFLARWLMFVSLEKDYTLPLQDCISYECQNALSAEVSKLKTISGEIRLSESAKKLYWDWYIEFTNDTPPHLTPWIERLTTNIHKIAMIYEASVGGCQKVSDGSLRLAIGLIDTLRTHLDWLSDELNLDEYPDDVCKVFATVKKAERIAQGQLSTKLWRVPLRDRTNAYRQAVESGRVRVIKEDKTTYFEWAGD